MSFHTRMNALRTKASQYAMQQIDADFKRASHQIKPVIRCIKDRLFDVNLQVEVVLRECKITDNSIFSRFAHELGNSIWQYVTDRRMEIAARMLLLAPNIEPWRIGTSIGYSGSSTFGRTFKRWSKQTPTQYRKNPQRSVEPSPQPEALIGEEEILDGLEGRLPAEQARALHYKLTTVADRLLEIYPFLRKPEDLRLRPVVGAEVIERLMAQVMWEGLNDKTFEQQQLLVRTQMRFTSTAFFDLLSEKSRQEGRRDRKKGLALAQLALDSLGNLAGPEPERISNLKARGWAWLGNCHRLLLNSSAAENAFQCGDAELKVLPEGDREAVAKAELALCKAGLRLFQRRFDEAILLSEEAAVFFREIDKPRRLAEALVLKSNAAHYSGRIEAALPDLLEAAELIAENPDAHLSLVVHVNLAAAYSAIGDTGENFADHLSQAKILCSMLNIDVVWNQLQWIEARDLLRKNSPKLAEMLFLEARKGFLAAGNADHAAEISLELCAFYEQEGRERDLMKMAREMMEVFKDFRSYEAGAVGLDLLEAAIAEKEFSLTMLQTIKHHFRKMGRQAFADRPMEYKKEKGIGLRPDPLE